MNRLFSLKLVFLLPLMFLINDVYADEIKMDWLIEGQLDDKIEKSEVVSSYEEIISKQNEESKKPVYTKFITNNEYAMGDYIITIDSEEGQILNGMLIEQRDLQDESFKHKIKYFDRFSDGYVEIAEALLDPIGDSKYIIQGRTYDYNPNSNLELFVLERGYTLDNLEAIPNDVFTPKEFTLGRAMMEEAIRSGEGEFDLRIYSPNYLRLNQEQIEEKMMNAFSEQTSQIFNQIISGENLQSETNLPETGVAISQPTRSIFDNFKFEKPKFENTRHVYDSLLGDSTQIEQLSRNFENLSVLLIIPVFVALAILGYMMRRKLSIKKLEPMLEVNKPQIDYKELTNNMIRNSLSLYHNNQRKEAHEVLSQAIRYYYSQSLGIYKEMTNNELLSNLRKSKSSEYDQVKNWLLLCGSVEYAKHKSVDDDFKEVVTKFSSILS